MIVTVTLNPAMDETVILDRLVHGETNRVKGSRTDPGGKGINVSRVLRELGAETLAMGFVSGSVGRFIEASLNELGIRDDFIHTPGQTRTNVVIVEEADNVNTTISVPGPDTNPHFVVELKQRLKKQLKEGTWVVFAGSLPPPLPPDTYVELIDMAHSCGAKAVLDASGEPLVLGMRRCPIMIKPNQQELSEIAGKKLTSVEEVLSQAREVHKTGIKYVVVSMGSQGAIGVSDDQAWLAKPPKIKVGSAVGAGDSMVAGIVHILSSGGDFVEGLRLGTAAGAAAAQSSGTQLAEAQDILKLLPEVQLTRL